VLLKSPHPGNSLAGATGHHIRVAGAGVVRLSSRPTVYSAFIHPRRADRHETEFATEFAMERVTFAPGLF